MIFIGVDPGLQGALVAIDEQLKIVLVADQPLNGREFDTRAMWHILCALPRSDIGLVVLERPGCRPQQSAQSGLKTGYGAGLWEGLIAALERPYLVVRPQDWQKGVFGGKAADRKGRALQFAARTFPALQLVTARGRKLDGRADAACLAFFARSQG